MSKKKILRDALSNRMKEFYETIPKTRLMRRCPVVIRIDGKAFHTYTRGFDRPFDELLIKTMQETSKYLCENIMGCMFAYTQSDEISLLLIDYKRLESSAWFDYEVQKMCSVSASMATMAFNRFFFKNIQNEVLKEHTKFYEVYLNVLGKAMFDARVFNIPKEEVTNYFYWRQLDATRNSIQVVGQANFSHKELQEKSCNDIKDMLMKQKEINWNGFPTYQKHGSGVVREKYFARNDSRNFTESPEGCTTSYENNEVESGVLRSQWIIDKEIPIFKGEGRKYIEQLVYIGEGD